MDIIKWHFLVSFFFCFISVISEISWEIFYRMPSFLFFFFISFLAFGFNIILKNFCTEIKVYIKWKYNFFLISNWKKKLGFFCVSGFGVCVTQGKCLDMLWWCALYKHFMCVVHNLVVIVWVKERDRMIRHT